MGISDIVIGSQIISKPSAAIYAEQFELSPEAQAGLTVSPGVEIPPYHQIQREESLRKELGRIFKYIERMKR